MDVDTGAFYFIEVNPRIQVEHTVTEVVHRARHRQGADPHRRRRSASASSTENRHSAAGRRSHLNGHALQCRITTENPENNFIPDYGRITAYRGAIGFGIRVDGGTAYSGAVVTRFYDPLLEKVTAWAPTPQEAITRMDRALARIPHPRRRHQSRLSGNGADPSEIPRQRLHDPLHRRDAGAVPSAARAATARPSCSPTIADVTVNGHPETRGRAKPPADARKPEPPDFAAAPPPDGAKQLSR